MTLHNTWLRKPRKPIGEAKRRSGRVRVISPEGMRIAGVLWPANWMPEEPLKGYKRYRDTCFRWQVEDLLHVNGWSFWHMNTSDTTRSDGGIPDLLCLREREMWLELKVRDRDGKPNGLSGIQQAFANRILEAGTEFHCVLWPDDWEELVRLTVR